MDPEWFEACKEDFEYFQKFLDRQKQECLAELIRIQNSRPKKPQDMVQSIDTWISQESQTTIEPQDSNLEPQNTRFVPNSLLNESNSSTETLEPGLEPGRGSTPRRGALCDHDPANIIRARTRSQVQPNPPVPVEEDEEDNSLWKWLF